MSSADLDFADHNRARKVDRYAEGYQAGVVHALNAMIEFFEENNQNVPWGIRGAVLSIIDGDEVK